jgi:magnesium-transporting ATPase (P-type)
MAPWRAVIIGERREPHRGFPERMLWRAPDERSRDRSDPSVSVRRLAFALAAGLALVGGMPSLVLAIAVVIVVNGTFSFVQEYRAERSPRALAALLPQAAVVHRGDRKVTVPAADVVVGDLLMLREGDRVPADARVIRSDGLRVDNSTMTGESEPVDRDASPLSAPVDDIAHVGNILLGGTFVASGAATAAVVATGARDSAESPASRGRCTAVQASIAMRRT